MINKFDGDYAFLSNFWPSPVMLDNEEYPTVEHAYQAAKTFDLEQRKKIRNAATPGKAKRIGQAIRLRKDWNFVREAIMLMLLIRKFKDPQLARLLKATGDQQLVEGNHWDDTFWGVCNGIGQNKLGKLLMRVRDGKSSN
jgi:ribA/ribD-fused uncharacterized protein